MQRLSAAPVLLFAAVTLAPQVHAGDYRDAIAEFFGLYAQGKKTEAVDRLYGTNPWMASATDAIQQIKTQFDGIEKLVGEYNGNELIEDVNIKDRFAHVTYLALYDRQPVRMEFQFYRPREEWLMFSYSFDIDFDDEVEAGVRSRIARGE